MAGNIVIVGNSEFAEIASEYFKRDYGYETVAFAVDKEFIREGNLLGHPVIEFDKLSDMYPPDKIDGVFVAAVYTQMNRLRERFCRECKEKGYRLLSYVSPHAFVWENVEIGENVFIFEDNTVQYNVKLHNNVILWSGNHIGHSAEIGENTFVSSHVVVSGYTKIGKNCFLGVNSCLGDNITFPDNSILAAGAVTTCPLQEGGRIYAGNPAKKMKKTAYEYFGVDKG